MLWIQALCPLDLRDHFVASSGDIEAIDEVTSDARGKIGPHLLHVEAHCRHFVVIENDLRLGLVDSGIDINEVKHSGLHRLELNLFCQIEKY